MGSDPPRLPVSLLLANGGICQSLVQSDRRERGPALEQCWPADQSPPGEMPPRLIGIVRVEVPAGIKRGRRERSDNGDEAAGCGAGV